MLNGDIEFEFNYDAGLQCWRHQLAPHKFEEIQKIAQQIIELKSKNITGAKLDKLEKLIESKLKIQNGANTTAVNARRSSNFLEFPGFPSELKVRERLYSSNALDYLNINSVKKSKRDRSYSIN